MATKKKERKAKIEWDNAESKWILWLWIDGKWAFSKSWGVNSEPVENNPLIRQIDWVSDSIVCEIAHLQDLDYEVSVTC